MKEIKLTQGLATLVDDEDFEELNKRKWYALKDNNTFYAVRAEPWKDGKREKTKMHRLILGAVDNEKVDHIDGNGLNNQKENIRICTTSQNAFNTKSKTNSTSKYKGVSYSKQLNKWKVTITIKDKSVHLGYFDSEEVAALTYDKKAKAVHGEFVRLNIA